MAYGARKSERVEFERGIPVYMMGIDGTWRRDCLMIDASQTGARLLIENSLEGLDLKEFFLLLSSTGLAYRRCQLVRVDGNQIGVEFLARKTAKRHRATDAHLGPVKPSGTTGKSLIVLNCQMLTSRRSQAYRPPYHSS
jgi:hypothetical protein